VLHVNGGSLMP